MRKRVTKRAPMKKTGYENDAMHKNTDKRNDIEIMGLPIEVLY